MPEQSSLTLKQRFTTDRDHAATTPTHKVVNMVFIRAAIGLFLASAAIASPISLETRDELITAQTLIGDISNINAGVESLRKHVAAFDGSLLTEAPLLADFTAIHLANRKGFADANL